MVEKRQTIRHRDYLALLGLMEIAKRLNRQVEQVVAAASAIVGEEKEPGSKYFSGHAADEAYGYDADADALLSRMNITVLPPEPVVESTGDSEG